MTVGKQCGSDPRLVGDPIDVVSGANVDEATMFSLAGRIPFSFRRFYNSARTNSRRGLGWGHAHSLDHYLEFDLDGITYLLPDGGKIGFEAIDIGMTSTHSGFSLTRLSETSYQIDDQDYQWHFKQVSRRHAVLTGIGSSKHQIELIRDDQNQLHEVIDSQGRTLRFTHDESRLLRSVVWRAGRNEEDWQLLELDYDEHGNLIAYRDPYGNRSTFEFSSRLMVKKTDPLGYRFTFSYDADDRCVRSVGQDGLHEVNLAYHPEQRCTEVIRGDQGSWLYFYSEYGSITEVIDPCGGKLTYEFNEQGVTVAEVLPSGRRLDWLYSREGKLLGKQGQSGVVFSGADDEIDDEDPFEFPIHDSPAKWQHGNLAQLSHRHVGLTHADYVAGESPEKLERIPESAIVNGKIETRDGETYDHFGNLIRQESELGVRRWNYDANGNVVKYVDRDGGIHEFEYDSWNVRKRETDPLGGVRSTEVNSERLIRKVVDSGGHEHRFEYDQADRLESVQRFGATKESYRYDSKGNLVAKLDGQGNSLVEYQHFDNGQVSHLTTSDGQAFQFEYDDFGQPLSIVSVDDTLALKFDGHGNRVQDQRNGSGVEHDFDDMLLLRSTVLGKFHTTYRDDTGRVRTVTDPMGGVHRFTHRRNGLEADLSNGLKIDSQFDPEGRLLKKATSHNSLLSLTRNSSYKYSGEGDLLQVKDSDAGLTEVRYDAKHRIRSIDSNRQGKFELAYDSADNLLFKPGLERVQVGSGNQLLAANNTEFQYNERHAVGRRTQGSRSESFVYDSLDQLVSVQSETMHWTARYDALGRRIETSGRAGKTTFVWDQHRLAAEIRADQSVRVYVYSDHLSLVPFSVIDYASLDAEPEDGIRYFVETNHLGAPTRLVDDEGHVVWQANYDAYGECSVSHAETEFNLRLPGQYFDQDIKLNYNGFRYYDPTLGRYLQPDPLGLGGGDNLYAYCQNPLVQVDLMGLNATRCGGTKGSGKKPSEQTKAKHRRHRKVGDGITRPHLQALRALAKKTGRIFIFREPNAKSRKYQGNPDYIPKPLGLPTRKIPDPDNPKGEKIRACSTGDDGLVKWRDKKDPPKGYKKDADGNLLKKCDDGEYRKMYSDYDLENVFDENKKTVNYNTNKGNTEGQANVKEMNDAIHGPGQTKEQSLVQHGPNGQYLKDDGTAKLPPAPDEKYTAVTPDGETLRFENAQQYKDWIDDNDLPWPY